MPPLALRALSAFALVALLSCGGGGGAPMHIPVVAAAPVAEGPVLATFVIVGDTIAHGMDPATDPLADVAALIEGADAFVLNHEGVLEASPLPVACGTIPDHDVLDADPQSVDAYARAPVVVTTVANNHVLDCGAGGLADTVAALRGRGFLTVGAGLEQTEACAPQRFSVAGLDTACAAYLAWPTGDFAAGPSTPGAATWDGCGAGSTVAALSADGAFVVVALHLHISRQWTPVTAPEHRALIEEALDAGADVVIAHGPHVPQGIRVRGGGVAFSSLGNFLFGGISFPDDARDVIVARVAVHARQLLVTLAAAHMDAAGVPRMATPAQTDRILDAIYARSAADATPLVRFGDRAYLLVER